MFIYEINIIDKQTKNILNTQEFSGNIIFRQIMSGKTYEETKNNISTCIFVYKPTENDTTVDSTLTNMLNYLNKYKHEIDNIDIAIYSKFQNKKYLIKIFNTISQVDLVFTSFNDEETPLGYQLTIKE